MSQIKITGIEPSLAKQIVDSGLEALCEPNSEYIIGEMGDKKLLQSSGIRIVICKGLDPDFNIYDYAVGTSPIMFCDRYMDISRNGSESEKNAAIIDFVKQIVSRPYNEAFRRNVSFWGRMYEKKIKRMRLIF